MMDLDLSSLWSWTIPLWGLFLIALFLGGVMTDKTVLLSLPLSRGGAIVSARQKKVRFAI